MYKPDYEPLLSAGRHEMTPAEFEKHFVAGLGGEARPEIWQRFKASVLDALLKFDIKCEIWIDGSFITKCPEPNDIDGSLMILGEVIDNLDEERLTYLKIFDDGSPSIHKTLDIFLCPMYPKGHPMQDYDGDPDGWAKQWSSEHNSGWLKGFVVIPFR